MWDVLQCSKAVAKCRLHQTVKVAYTSVPVLDHKSVTGNV